MLDIWAKTRAASKGGPAVYDGNFLRRFNPEDKERQEQYKKGAYYMNITGRTQEALLGAIFRHDPETDVPALLEYVMENADGAGQSLAQVGKEICSDVMETGRYGILADYPEAPENLTIEQVRVLDLRPYMCLYPAESIIKLKVKTILGKSVLSLVVLKEPISVEQDEFNERVTHQFRVLRLRDGVFTVQVYDDEENPVTEQYAPLRGTETWDRIPFHIIGAMNNLPAPDMPPLYPLAELNIAHYQTTADHRENLFMHGQLTLGISSNLSPAAFAEANPSGVIVGARAGHFLGPNGKFTTATAPESSSLRVALQDLREEMASIGAKLVSKGGQAETAETARINAASELSVLDMLVGNVSEAMEAALEDMAIYQGADPEQVEFRLNTDFFEDGIDPQQVMADIALYDRGLVAKQDVRRNLRQAGRLDPARTDEEIDIDAADTIVNNTLDE
jgi:hypothetical protein